MVSLSTTAATFNVPTNITKATTISSTLNVTGATTLSSTLGVTGATTLTSATIDSATVNNMNVYGELRAAKYSIETVQNLGGHFLVCPTIELPSDAGGFSCQVTSASGTLTISFTDNSLSTDVFAGTTWTANSKVKVTGMINNVALGTCDGTITSWNKTTKTVTVSITCGTAVSSKFSTSATSYTSTQVSDLSIMMYEVYTNSTTYPIGIYITSYGKNKYSYIDIYGGTSDKPTTRMGKLDGLDAVNNTNPTGWGFYSAQNGYFQGTIVSSAGKIGNWNISTALYSGTNSMTSTTVGTYLGTDGLRSYKDTNTYVDIKNGVITAKAVDLTGKITASTGAIGGFEIVSTAIKTLNVAVTSNADNSISLSSADFTRTINSTSRAGLRFAIGDKFGITGDGTLYANGANITAINAGNISTGYLSADRINANTLTIGKFTTVDQNKILNENI